MGVEVYMSVYSTLYLVPSKKRLQVNALLQHGKKSGKGFKVCKKRMLCFVLLSKIMMLMVCLLELKKLRWLMSKSMKKSLYRIGN